jgi:hypothetical protein
MGLFEFGKKKKKSEFEVSFDDLDTMFEFEKEMKKAGGC